MITEYDENDLPEMVANGIKEVLDKWGVDMEQADKNKLTDAIRTLERLEYSLIPCNEDGSP